MVAEDTRGSVSAAFVANGLLVDATIVDDLAIIAIESLISNDALEKAAD